MSEDLDSINCHDFILRIDIIMSPDLQKLKLGFTKVTFIGLEERMYPE